MADSIPRVSATKHSHEPAREASSGRGSARVRILVAITRATVECGYENTTLRRLLSESQVARATFYRHFQDKRECLLAAQRQAAEHLLNELAAGSSDPWSSLTSFAGDEPFALRLLADIPLYGDPKVLAQHHRIRGEIAHAVRQRTEALEEPTFRYLVGAAVRVVARNTSHSAGALTPVTGQIAHWLSCYRATDLLTSHMKTQTAVPLLMMTATPSSTALEDRDTSDRPASPKVRIMRALVHAHGSGDAPCTLSELAALAGISREAFYGHFPNMTAVIKRTRQIVFADVMALCMQAFSASEQWPEQVWRACHGLTSFFATHPKLARFIFENPLEPLPAIPDNAHCLDAFTMFLSTTPASDEAPERRDLTGQLIAATITELISHQMTCAPPEQLLGVSPLATYLVLSPSIGAQSANDFVRSKLKQLSQGEH